MRDTWTTATQDPDRVDLMGEQTTVLVTGANKGIGYEIAAGLGALGWKVGVGARDEQRREAAVEGSARPAPTLSGCRWT